MYLWPIALLKRPSEVPDGVTLPEEYNPVSWGSYFVAATCGNNTDGGQL